jgi:hypothetical protein
MLKVNRFAGLERGVISLETAGPDRNELYALLRRVYLSRS